MQAASAPVQRYENLRHFVVLSRVTVCLFSFACSGLRARRVTQLDAGVLDAELQTMLASSVSAAANSLHVRVRGCVSGCVRGLVAPDSHCPPH